MSNVFQLSNLKKKEDRSSDSPNANATISSANILALCAQLSCAVEELSKYFGAVDRVIDGVDDAQTRQLMKFNRRALTTATLELSRAIRKLPRLQIDGIADVAK